MRQRARELSTSVQTELLDQLEARRLQRSQFTSATTAGTAKDAVDGSSTQTDILQRIQQCLLAVQTLQVTFRGYHIFCTISCTIDIRLILPEVGCKNWYISYAVQCNAVQCNETIMSDV